MYKLLSLILLNVFLYSFISCKDSDSEPIIPEEKKTEIDFSNMKNGEKIRISYSENGGKHVISEYNATKIGEYLWMDSNFKNPIEGGHEVSQHQINKCLNIYRIDTMRYTITPQEFTKYFGQYYSRDMIERMSNVGNMFESSFKLNNGKWDLPTAAAFRQLFAMCGNAGEIEVRRTLCYKVEEIPIMRTTPNAYWIDSENTNKYGFNLLFSGGRCHNNEFPWGLCYGPNDCHQFSGNKGDLYTFYAAVMYPAAGSITAKIHDFPDTRDSKIWAWLPVRWCRRLTAKELGYELFVNKGRTDIIELEPDASTPDGYEILPDGYLRGFYVQYMLRNPNSNITVKQLREIEKNLDEVKRGTPLT